MLKESPGFFSSWDERYVILKGERFVYKESSSPISPNAGILNFNLLSCDVVPYELNGQIDHFKYLFPYKNSR